MPAAIPFIAVAIAAASTTYSAVEANQATQHAKGAAEAQATATQAQLDTAKKTDDASNAAKATQGGATQQSALAALRSSMSASSGMGGSILTSPTGTAMAPTATKTLLGA